MYITANNVQWTTGITRGRINDEGQASETGGKCPWQWSGIWKHTYSYFSNKLSAVQGRANDVSRSGCQEP